MQTPREKTVRFAVAAALLEAALFYASNRQSPPPVPEDADHRAAAADDACEPCHGRGSPHPLSPRHPPKDDCLLCHGRKR